MTITPYLNLNGNAEEALNFYQRIFGGSTEIMRWGEIPEEHGMTGMDDWQDKIMHASLQITDDIALYVSDSWRDKTPPVNSVFLHVQFDTEEELRKAYKALSDGGEINMPLDNTFWGALYGDLIDKYGTGWGLQYQFEE